LDGRGPLLEILLESWSDTCALLQLALSFTLAFQQPGQSPNKRSTEGMTALDHYVYTDGMGVPQGVPDELKAGNQIAAGFQSALFWWSTVNKNVDWINYIC
jgi:hypothetical protein